jgi:hypothetical protein
MFSRPLGAAFFAAKGELGWWCRRETISALATMVFLRKKLRLTGESTPCLSI